LLKQHDTILGLTTNIWSIFNHINYFNRTLITVLLHILFDLFCFEGKHHQMTVTEKVCLSSVHSVSFNCVVCLHWWI